MTAVCQTEGPSGSPYVRFGKNRGLFSIIAYPGQKIKSKRGKKPVSVSKDRQENPAAIRTISGSKHMMLIAEKRNGNERNGR